MPRTLDEQRTPIDESGPNSKGRLTLIVLFSSVVGTLLLMAPAVAGQLQEQLGLTPSQTGDLFSAELGAMSLASIPALWWMKRLNTQKASIFFAAVFVVGNISSAYIDQYGLLLATRFLTSLAGGSLMVLCMSLAAQADNRNRVYGLWVMGQLLFGAVGLAVLPHFFSSFGIGIVYWVLAVMMVFVLPLARFLPKRAVVIEAARGQTRLNTGYALRATLGLLAVLAFYISLSGIWTFVSGVASTSDIDAQTSSFVLSVATVLGIAGSAVATVLGARPGTRTNLLVGYLAMALSLGLLVDVPGLVRFTVAALLFKFTWTFILPYILATLSELDRSGRLVNVANIAIGGGFALGPLMGGRLVENTGGYGALIAVSTAGLLLSLAMILAAQPRNSSNLNCETAR
ncbi:putative MFS family arabinose efflux permease [Prauserella sediminis]|uniref:Putative MFS family arabinose efflux permease n=1 Tax=Prauserella sediminis TaxID=577680 RepID=A0A839XXS7_9PSEU|nr:MFS transporter [Prauserella sediminis]MBB3664575.1 putative MFS family arabinose efflux permease [Prauserella sediminis]